MSPVSFPAQVQVTETAAGTRYLFPAREAAWWKGALSIPFFLALILGVGWLGGAWLNVCTLVLAPVLLLALGLILYTSAGRCEIHLAGGDIVAVERLGPLRWSCRRRLARVRRLVVGHVPRAAEKGNETFTELLANQPGRAALVAQCDGGKPMVLAAGYAHAWLLAVAHDLSRRGAAAAGHPPAARPLLPVAESGAEPLRFHERPDPPAGSRVGFERHPEGVTLVVPPPGFRGWAGCLLLFALMWLAAGLFCVVLTAARPEALVTAALCAAVGLSVLALASSFSRRRAVLAVVGDRLMVLKAALLRSERREWGREEVADVCTGDSRISINDEPVPELQIHLRSGQVFGLLALRQVEELEWMATVLRHSLRVPTHKYRPPIAQE